MSVPSKKHLSDFLITRCRIKLIRKECRSQSAAFRDLARVSGFWFPGKGTRRSHMYLGRGLGFHGVHLWDEEGLSSFSESTVGSSTDRFDNRDRQMGKTYSFESCAWLIQRQTLGKGAKSFFHNKDTTPISDSISLCGPRFCSCPQFRTRCRMMSGFSRDPRKIGIFLKILYFEINIIKIRPFQIN